MLFSFDYCHSKSTSQAKTVLPLQSSGSTWSVLWYRAFDPVFHFSSSDSSPVFLIHRNLSSPSESVMSLQFSRTWQLRTVSTPSILNMEPLEEVTLTVRPLPPSPFRLFSHSPMSPTNPSAIATS